jgi:hypothetical protein
MTLTTPEIYGYTIFCDDIRQEVGGKISFVGVYSGTIFVHGEFPVTLPKFAFGISLIQRRELVEPNIEVQIFLPGDAEDSPSIRGQLSEPMEGALAAQIARGVDETATMHINLVAASLTFKEPGIMKVRAIRRGDLIRLGSIRITSQPQSSASSPADIEEQKGN